MDGLVGIREASRIDDKCDGQTDSIPFDRSTFCPLAPLWGHQAEDLPKGGGKQATKARMLMGYLVDPSLGELFMSATQKLSFQEDVSREERWISRKQLLDMFDESEAEEMISEQKIE
eukprot:4668070-Pyramimonas_sp.AAC.1